MDTEIIYKYTDALGAKVEGRLTLAKVIYKKFTGSYDTKHDDPLTRIERRLWNCHLFAYGFRAVCFLKDIIDFMGHLGFEKGDDDYEKLELLHQIFKSQKEDGLYISLEMW